MLKSWEDIILKTTQTMSRFTIKVMEYVRPRIRSGHIGYTCQQDSPKLIVAMEAILRHELGHAMGLGHYISEEIFYTGGLGHPSSIMVPILDVLASPSHVPIDPRTNGDNACGYCKTQGDLWKRRLGQNRKNTRKGKTKCQNNPDKKRQNNNREIICPNPIRPLQERPKGRSKNLL